MQTKQTPSTSFMLPSCQSCSMLPANCHDSRNRSSKEWHIFKCHKDPKTPGEEFKLDFHTPDKLRSSERGRAPAHAGCCGCSHALDAGYAEIQMYAAQSHFLCLLCKTVCPWTVCLQLLWKSQVLGLLFIRPVDPVYHLSNVARRACPNALWFTGACFTQ